MSSRNPSAGEREYMATLAAVVRALRVGRGDGVAATAHALGLSLSSYKRLERGDYLASGYDLQRLGRHFGLDANLLVFGFTLIGDPQIGPVQVVKRWQRLVYRLRALDLQQQAALEGLVRDLYRLHLDRGGSSAERAALEAERRLRRLLAETGAGV